MPYFEKLRILDWSTIKRTNFFFFGIICIFLKKKTFGSLSCIELLTGCGIVQIQQSFLTLAIVLLSLNKAAFEWNPIYIIFWQLWYTFRYLRRKVTKKFVFRQYKFDDTKNSSLKSISDKVMMHLTLCVFHDIDTSKQWKINIYYPFSL